MTEQWFLRVDGIPGESVDERHRDAIDVVSWSLGVAVPGGLLGRLGSSVARAGRVSFDPLVVEAVLGLASPPLLLACATNRRLDRVELIGARGGAAGGQDVLTYTFEDVTVVAVQHADGPAAAPTDRVTFAYGTIRMTYRPQRPDGSLGTPVVAAFDVRAGRVL